MYYLHTWGQTLSFHPHIHCIIPAEGLSPNNQWIKSKKNFFIPVRVIANMFRGEFLAFFKNEVPASNIKFYTDIDYFNSDKNYQDFVDALYNRVGPVFRLGPLVKLHVRFSRIQLTVTVAPSQGVSHRHRVTTIVILLLVRTIG
ncbi:transposase [Halocella sp. SP3-1]|uniref:transposase n=1 Tax=Halocella sp. SP3-1 TaxID=2382161 RepID=UPI000F760A2D|nr:transposase [Halocella sp. SP3-1]AZO94943.1 hypothetical protein D7D81_10265 [Halocella sp. SP3-1]